MLSVTVIAALLGLLLLWKISRLVLDPLRSIPGPTLARFTNLWAIYRLYRGRAILDVVELHRRHQSKVIRIKPNEFSISDPEAIKIIHGRRGDFDKAAAYKAFTTPGRETLFSEPNKHPHEPQRKKFSPMYTMSSVVAYQKGVEECVEVLCRRLSEHAGQEIKFLWWTTSYATDSVWAFTYGKRLGCLDLPEGADMHGIVGSIRAATKYATYMVQVPWLHYYYHHLSVALSGIAPWMQLVKLPFNDLTIQTIARRRKERAENPGKIQMTEDGPTTMLDRFLDANDSDPNHFTEFDVFAGLVQNVVAGTETSGSTLTAIMYYLLKNPETLTKLRAEIAPTSSPISVKEARALPYLAAVITEGLRLFPQTGFGLPRIVPPGGAHISGHDFPAGSVVSMNAWAVHRDPENFEDPEKFKPERWLTEEKAKLARMTACYFPWGLGDRNCIGTNVAQMMMLKVLPELVRRFDFQLRKEMRDEKDLNIVGVFAIRPVEMPVVVRPVSM